MPLPLHELAYTNPANAIVRLTENGLEIFSTLPEIKTTLIPDRPLQPGEQYRFHFNMNKCIGCRSCEVACNEQNGNPADLRWRRIGEIEGGTWPDTARHYQWYPWHNNGHYRLWHYQEVDRSAPISFYRQGIEAVIRRAHNGFRVGIPFIWCSNNLLVALVTQGVPFTRLKPSFASRISG